MEREKSRKNLNVKEASYNFDLSDLKNDKTQYMDKTQFPRSTPNSPFEPKEISARSTHIQSKQKYGNLDFDEIMKTSSSEAVRNKYRESISNGRISNFPTTSNASFRSSVSNENMRTTSTSNRKDFWDEANPSFSSFTGKNLTFSNEEFVPAEEMANQLDEDEKMQEMEYAAIPRQNIPQQEETMNWESNALRQPEMSFGQFCNDRINQQNIREVYNKASPPKRQDRVPLVNMTVNESVINEDEFKNSALYNSKNLEAVIRKCDPSQAERLLFKKDITNKVNKFSKGIAEVFGNNQNENGYSSSVVKIMQDLNVDRIMELAEKERSRMRQEKENERLTSDNTPVQDECNDDLQRYRNELQIPNRGVKRRPSLVSNDTPKSALDKCLRSRSPTNYKEIEAAAARLKPKIMSDENMFKKPFPCNSTLTKNYTKSPSKTLTENSENNSSSREYMSAMQSVQSLSLRSPGEKLSLPNYSLKRPEKPTFTSPTSSDRSENNEFRIRRSASQLSNDSEFNDDFLPLKIDNIDNRKISFSSVKIDKSVTKSIGIQNGSNKKLPLRVKVIGPGFSVSPQEEFRMVPREARTFSVKFTPNIVGPARGCLIFELVTNKQSSISIPLYGYGGHSNICIDGIQKGPFGPSFITMGTVQDLSSLIEHKIKLTNRGTLPSFASLALERTKLSDFVLSNSIYLEPKQLRIEPGKSADVTIKFRPTKSEIRKIISINKDVSTIGEICVLTGDEATRLRILKHQHLVEQKFLDYLPKSLPNDIEIQQKLQKFDESMSRDKLTSIMSEIRTYDIALTINRYLQEDTICFSTEVSMADDTHMSYKTFVNQTNLPSAMDTVYNFDEHDESMEFLESKYFRISPSEILFKRSTDNHETVKVVKIVSLCDELLYVEAVPSNNKLVSALKPCGKLCARDTCDIKVSATRRAYENTSSLNASVILIIRDARIEIPVRIVD